jgi:hypothetical protein
MMNDGALQWGNAFLSAVYLTDGLKLISYICLLFVTFSLDVGRSKV